jgi:hypothetical protein
MLSITTARCGITQKSAYFIYFVAEAQEYTTDAVVLQKFIRLNILKLYVTVNVYNILNGNMCMEGAADSLVMHVSG